MRDSTNNTSILTSNFVNQQPCIRSQCSWDIYLCAFQSPEGRTENSPGLQAWEGLEKENRPEKAAESEVAGNEEYVVIKFNASASFAINCFRKTLSLEVTPGTRPPFQGDSLSARLPRAEALGYSLFALRATAEFPDSRDSKHCHS
jgi:hypothetical protein